MKASGDAIRVTHLFRETALERELPKLQDMRKVLVIALEAMKKKSLTAA